MHAKPSSMARALPLQQARVFALSSVCCNLLPHPLQEAGIDAEQAMGLLVSSRPEPPPFQGAKQILRWEDKIVSHCPCCSRPALCAEAEQSLCSESSTPLKGGQRLCIGTTAKSVGAAPFLCLPGTNSQFLPNGALELCTGSHKESATSPPLSAPAARRPQLSCAVTTGHCPDCHPRVAARSRHPDRLPHR